MESNNDVEHKKPSALETLAVMGRDLAEKNPVSRKTLDRIADGFRASARFLRDAGRGYIAEQATYSAYAYRQQMMRRFPRNSGGVFGLFIGALQDSLCLAGLCKPAYEDILSAGNADAYFAAASVIVGAKIVSNVTAGLTKWYISARERARGGRN